ncbi:hypothetical protein AYK26_06510 [Euryarchaeota archaeon SM23-78]|nr:MAG: hypothetical protein AYK26_06510 [Euryarchaeota archaeon SM23-78]MBW3000598.1 hypothetical protein [Candidatus Woesearchaeota archaeon]
MWGIRKELETRKENLIYTLKNKRDFLELEKQHQIYGAIKELDHVLRLMEHLREQEFVNKPRQLVLNSNDTEEESTLKKVDEQTRKFKSPITIRFAKSDA